MTETRTHPATGAMMRRDVRPITLSYHGRSVTIDMPGWYADDGISDGLHDGADMEHSDRALAQLMAETAALE